MKSRVLGVGFLFCTVAPLVLAASGVVQAPRNAAGRSAVQRLVTDPGGVEVVVDGISRGMTGVETGILVLRDLPFGERNFILRRRGYEPVRFAVRYEHEQTGEIFVGMKRLQAPPQAGTLLLDDVIEMMESDLALEPIAALVRKKGVAMDLAGEAAWRRLAATAKLMARRKQLSDLFVAGAAQDVLRGDYASAIGALEFAGRLDPGSAAVRTALERTRRARETELEVLSRR